MFSTRLEPQREGESDVGQRLAEERTLEERAEQHAGQAGGGDHVAQVAHLRPAGVLSRQQPHRDQHEPVAEVPEDEAEHQQERGREEQRRLDLGVRGDAVAPHEALERLQERPVHNVARHAALADVGRVRIGDLHHDAVGSGVPDGLAQPVFLGGRYPAEDDGGGPGGAEVLACTQQLQLHLEGGGRLPERLGMRPARGPEPGLEPRRAGLQSASALLGLPVKVGRRLPLPGRYGLRLEPVFLQHRVHGKAPLPRSHHHQVRGTFLVGRIPERHHQHAVRHRLLHLRQPGPLSRADLHVQERRIGELMDRALEVLVGGQLSKDVFRIGQGLLRFGQLPDGGGHLGLDRQAERVHLLRHGQGPVLPLRAGRRLDAELLHQCRHPVGKLAATPHVLLQGLRAQPAAALLDAAAQVDDAEFAQGAGYLAHIPLQHVDVHLAHGCRTQHARIP
ncbi:MAG: hypothetical protein AMK73_08220 [Planctomycetes bacterium SM23_32]|nr:MAG: hypothetical protein AMK73_08220 [Planctomycetes bacterium SM23_32]